jgi:lysophospholipase L1-like esterase
MKRRSTILMVAVLVLAVGCSRSTEKKPRPGTTEQSKSVAAGEAKPGVTEKAGAEVAEKAKPEAVEKTDAKAAEEAKPSVAEKAKPKAAKKVKPKAVQPPKAEPTTEPVSRGEKFWTDRQAKLNERVKRGNVKLLFIGDSITQGWEGAGKGVWRNFYSQRGAVNLGIGGDRTQHVLWRLQNGNIDGVSPKLAVLMIGTNNSGSNTPEEIAEGVTKIVGLLREKLPAMKILILSIFPRGADKNDAQRQVNEKANKLIEKLADGENVIVMDIGGRFTKPDGTLTREVMPDLLHLSPPAYQSWAEAIEPVVARVMTGGPLEAPPAATPEAPEASEEGFVSLFDGKTLDGWRKAGGGATYKVEDGCIVGRVGPGANTFLCTTKDYGDFILKLELKLDVPVNSGIQIRSHERPKGGPVFGYQVEVDPTDRGWSGGIYDEQRRGWLCSLAANEPALHALKRDDWNQYVIKAVGPSIKTWINGVPCADIVDDIDATGFIGLQVHAAKEGQIRWKNIRIKELGKTAE